MPASTRTVLAAIVLVLYYWFLIHPESSADAPLDRDVEDSRTLFEARRYADALAPTERLAVALPSQAIYHDRLARILRELDRPADEARGWESVMEHSPTPVDACPMIADAYRRAGNGQQELAALERCATLPPVNPDFLVFLGQALLRGDRKADAKQAFERGLTVDGDYPDLHLLLGVRQFEDGEMAAARRSFERFIELAPSRRGEAAVWLGRVEQAQ